MTNPQKFNAGLYFSKLTGREVCGATGSSPVEAWTRFYVNTLRLLTLKMKLTGQIEDWLKFSSTVDVFS